MSADEKWAEELELLRAILQKSGLNVAIKWGTEVYTHRGKNVVGAMAFKDYCSLWFYNGVFLKDKQKHLVIAQGGKTKALRHWRFTSKDQINEKLILEYIREAVRNAEKGLVWKPVKSDPAEIPELLSRALKKDRKLKSAFEKLTPYKQKEYIEYMNAAKREETRISRLEKSIPMISEGLGLNDKYKKK